MGAGHSTQQAPQESLYEILGVEKNATDLEMKKAYRKEALRLHPDRNHGREEEATKEFARVQAAYDVLSDPQERAWYDSHGSSGGGPTEPMYGGEVTTTEDLKKYMEMEIKSTDEFFIQINQLFSQLKREEQEAALDDNVSSYEKTDASLLPDFGDKNSSFDKHVKPFYDTWASFNTIKDFAWEDIYRAWDAPDRRTRRAAEQRNKKIREAAKKEFNTTVRRLVTIIRTRDPRVKQNNKKKQQKPGNSAAKEQRKKDRQQFMQNRGEHVEQDWERVDDDEYMNEQDAAEEGGEEDGEMTVFECVVCDKEFKTKKQLKSHESSKKHAKAVAMLKREMKKEGVELGFDKELSGSEEDVKKGKKSNYPYEQEHEQFPKAPEPEEPQNDDENSESEEEEEREKAEKEKEKIKTKKRRGNQPKIIIESSDSESSDNDDDDVVVVQREPISQDATLDDLLAQLESTKMKDEPEVQVKGKAKQKRAKKSKQVNEFALICSVCHAEFSSRNKLFDHVKASGHAAPVGTPISSSGKKNKNKKK